MQLHYILLRISQVVIILHSTKYVNGRLMFFARCLTHRQSLSRVVSVGRAPAFRLLFRISSFYSELRIDNLHSHFTQRLSLNSTPLNHRGSPRYSEKVSRPSVRVTAKQPVSGSIVRGSALGEQAQCLAVCRSAVGDLSLRRSVLCCEVCGGRQRQLAVSPKPSKPYEYTRKQRTLSRISEKLTLELAGMCIYLSATCENVHRRSGQGGSILRDSFSFHTHKK